MAEQPTPKNAPTWIKVWVALHVFAVIVWSLPWPPEGIRKGTVEPVGSDWLLVWNGDYLKQIPVLRAYMLCTGNWQYWDMFAPNPVRIDTYGSAEAVFADGTVKEFRYPRIADMPIPQKYYMERYRKFFERVNANENSFAWPEFGQAIARQMDDPANPPVRVRLYRHTKRIMPPGAEQPKEHTKTLFYDYLVDQKALEESRRER